MPEALLCPRCQSVSKRVYKQTTVLRMGKPVPKTVVCQARFGVQRDKQGGVKTTYRYLLRSCPPCNWTFCLRQLKIFNNQEETDWMATEWVETSQYNQASITPGVDNIGNTASQHTQEESAGNGIRQAEKRAELYYKACADKTARALERLSQPVWFN